MSSRPHVLFVLTSHAKLPNGNPIGWYLPEFAHPYDALVDHADITIASPQGGVAPLDLSSVEAFKDKSSTEFFQNKKELWEKTRRLDEFLGKAAEFDAIFYVGGHGPMFDLASSPVSIQLILEFYEAKKIVSAVCHGPAAFINVVLPSGEHLLAGQSVTAFSDSEEEASGLAPQMPFSLQQKLNEASGGKFEKAEDWKERVVVARGGKLITGQNPASASAVGKAILEALGGKA